MSTDKISTETVRADFNDINAVVHYARAAHRLGLWKSEQIMFAKHFTDHEAPLLELGCGAGRVTFGLYELGYRSIFALDFADELISQARSFAEIRVLGEAITFAHGDATRLEDCEELNDFIAASPQASKSSAAKSDGAAPGFFAGAFFTFNGLMQIPGRENRRTAMRGIARLCRPGAPFLFTTHDRDESPREKALWVREAALWARGKQDPRLVEFGDRYFEHEHGRTFMHLPTRDEILEDLAATGWTHHADAFRREISAESRSVTDFSDECRFWIAHKATP